MVALTEKEKAHKKEYYQKNKEAIKEKVKQYRIDHKEETKIRGKKYNESNRDKKKIYNKQYHKENKERITEKHKEWCDKNKDYIKMKHKQYREEHKDELSINHKKYSEEHKDELKIYQKQYREAHKGEAKEYHKNYSKQWYIDNMDREKKKNKNYRESHKEEYKAKRAARRLEVLKYYSDNNISRYKPKSEDHKRKISEAQKGKIVSEETCKKISDWHMGRPLSEEHRISMSMRYQGITNRSDWIGYLIETLYCKLFTPEFKLRQYEISDYTCILCNTKVEKPHCHHVYEQKASCCQTIDDQGDLFFMIRNQKFYPYILPMVDKEKELEYGLNKFAVLCNKCHGKVKGKKNGKSVFDYIHEIEQIINTKYKGRSYYTREEYWGNGYYQYLKGEREIYCDAVTGEIYGKYLRGFQEYGLPKK